MKMLFLLFLLLLAAPLQAQTVGPTAKYQWDMSAPTVTEAATYLYVVTDDIAPAGRTLSSVTCAASNGGTGQTCQAPILSYPNGMHSVTLTYVLNTVTSLPSNTATFTYQTPVTSPCGGTGNSTITIAVMSWTPNVGVGMQGQVIYTFTPSPSAPIVATQVRLDAAVASALAGTDLRSITGQTFSVPRTVGTYNLTVWAQDANGCMATTTAARPVRVQ